MRWTSFLFLLLVLLAPTVQAADPDVIHYPCPLSENDTRFDYHLSLLREALTRTTAEYGPVVLRPAPITMNQLRQFDMLRSGHPCLDVIIKPTSIDREKILTPVRIPLEKGLLGWRILLIHRNRQETYAAIQDIDDLKMLTLGQGRGWNDVTILRHNGLTVVEGGSYEGLFKMLLSDRFDCFPRGVTEAFEECDTRREELPYLHVEETLLLHYPFARYFWTANNARGKRLHARITKGLESMIADGTFDSRFNRHYGDISCRVGFKMRTLIRLKNPNLPPETPLDRKELWLHPCDH